MFFDPYYLILVMPAVLIALAAQVQVKSAFHRYSQVHSFRGITAAMVARRILDRNGLQNVRIEQVAGELSDHFDPRSEVVRLSASTYSSTSVAAIGVAAHECGHAIQYAQGYFPLTIRNAIIPITNIGSQLAFPLAILGLVFGLGMLVDIGIILFMVVVFFQLVTLPVEFNASKRALRILEEDSILESGEELAGAKKMLSAAAMTYVAALIVALANLARLILLSNRRQR